MDFTGIPYTREHQLNLAKKFDCGNSYINSFLHSTDSLDYGYGSTYVIILGSMIIGYYNIGMSCLVDENDIRMGGSVYINYLALDKKYHKTKVGNSKKYFSDLLLYDCLNRIEYIRQNYIGVSFITLSSSAEGIYLYERNGFMFLDDDMKIFKNKKEGQCVPMYLPLDLE